WLGSGDGLGSGEGFLVFVGLGWGVGFVVLVGSGCFGADFVVVGLGLGEAGSFVSVGLGRGSPAGCLGDRPSPRETGTSLSRSTCPPGPRVDTTPWAQPARTRATAAAPAVARRKRRAVLSGSG